MSGSYYPAIQRHVPEERSHTLTLPYEKRGIYTMPVPVAARSKAWVCGRSPAEIVDSNLTRGMDVCLLCVLCVVR